MTADPITTWLGGPDTGEPPQHEPAPKAMGSAEGKADDPGRDPTEGRPGRGGRDGPGIPRRRVVTGETVRAL